MLTVKTKGNFKNIEKLINKKDQGYLFEALEKCGHEGVKLLREATPKDTGKTSDSWKFEIVKKSKGPMVRWYNTVMAGNTALVILLQYGHAITGGYIEGTDFINPVIEKVSDSLRNLITEKLK